jgi:hypothetical protein
MSLVKRFCNTNKPRPWKNCEPGYQNTAWWPEVVVPSHISYPHWSAMQISIWNELPKEKFDTAPTCRQIIIDIPWTTIRNVIRIDGDVPYGVVGLDMRLNTKMALRQYEKIGDRGDLTAGPAGPAASVTPRNIYDNGSTTLGYIEPPAALHFFVEASPNLTPEQNQWVKASKEDEQWKAWVNSTADTKGVLPTDDQPSTKRTQAPLQTNLKSPSLALDGIAAHSYAQGDTVLGQLKLTTLSEGNLMKHKPYERSSQSPATKDMVGGIGPALFEAQFDHEAALFESKPNLEFDIPQANSSSSGLYVKYGIHPWLTANRYWHDHDDSPAKLLDCGYPTPPWPDPEREKQSKRAGVSRHNGIMEDGKIIDTLNGKFATAPPESPSVVTITSRQRTGGFATPPDPASGWWGMAICPKIPKFETIPRNRIIVKQSYGFLYQDGQAMRYPDDNWKSAPWNTEGAALEFEVDFYLPMAMNTHLPIYSPTVGNWTLGFGDQVGEGLHIASYFPGWLQNEQMVFSDGTNSGDFRGIYKKYTELKSKTPPPLPPNLPDYLKPPGYDNTSHSGIPELPLDHLHLWSFWMQGPELQAHRYFESALLATICEKQLYETPDRIADYSGGHFAECGNGLTIRSPHICKNIGRTIKLKNEPAMANHPFYQVDTKTWVFTPLGYVPEEGDIVVSTLTIHPITGQVKGKIQTTNINPFWLSQNPLQFLFGSRNGNGFDTIKINLVLIGTSNDAYKPDNPVFKQNDQSNWTLGNRYEIAQREKVWQAIKNDPKTALTKPELNRLIYGVGQLEGFNGYRGDWISGDPDFDGPGDTGPRPG